MYHFVIPDPGASISGGNIFNLGLVSALRATGVEVRVVDRGAGPMPAPGPCLVDSLYLEDVPRFAPCWLLAHYLPALVEGRDALSPLERAALLAADGFVVPSDFMARALTRLAPEPRPIRVVAPGIDVAHSEAPRVPRAVLVANLVPGKGVLPFLEALAARPLPLAVIGSRERDPAYAAACRFAAAPSVAFLGELSHSCTLAEIAASDFLVSSSRMESFGLALAEARALGVPILARAGGNAAAHVCEAAGGRLFDSDEQLAHACVAIARDPVELARRRRQALALVPARRTWIAAAQDFRAAFRD